MEQFVIPTWIWLNAGVLLAAAAYTAVRLRGSHEAAVSSRPASYRPVRAS